MKKKKWDEEVTKQITESLEKDFLRKQIEEANRAAEEVRRQVLASRLAEKEHTEGSRDTPLDQDELTFLQVGEDGPQPEEYEPEELEENIEIENNEEDDDDEGLDALDEEQQKSRLKRIFDVFDTDGDGYITSKELKDFAAQMGVDISYNDVHQGFSDIDTDGSGTVNFDTFVKWWSARQKIRDLRRSRRSGSLSSTPVVIESEPIITSPPSLVKNNSVKFELVYRQITDEVPHVYGSIKELGDWDTKKSLPLIFSPGNIWTIDIKIPSSIETFEYNYFIIDSNGIITSNKLPNRVAKVLEDVVLKEIYQDITTDVDNVITNLIASRERRREQKKLFTTSELQIASEEVNQNGDSEPTIDDTDNNNEEEEVDDSK